MRAKRRERSMRISDFHIGLEFWMSGRRYRTTDVGSRLVVAIRLDHDEGLALGALTLIFRGLLSTTRA